MKLQLLRSPNGELEAAFVPDAGLVGCSLTHRGEELLGQRKGLDEYRRSGSTFGIPLLHPWANRLGGFAYALAGREVTLEESSPLVRTEEHGLPIHGLGAWGLNWEVLEAEPMRARVELDGERLAAFPFPHRLETEIELEDGALTIRTTLAPTGGAAVPVAFGYHPYLTLPGTPRGQWEVELPVEQRLVTDENAIPTGELAPAEFRRGVLGERSLDDGYLAPDRPFTVSAGGRTLGVELLEGYTHAQVYAPPDQDLICFEPMTAPADALRSHEGLRLAAPGEPFTAAFCVTVDG